MKIGVPVFSYAKSRQLQSTISQHGCATINLGDYVQSIAIRRLLRRLEVHDSNILDVDRDTLCDYSGPPVALVMNCVFSNDNFPPAENVFPIFVGFRAAADVIAKNAAYLRRFAPIGCRDVATRENCLAHGIDAYASGCVTLTLQRRQSNPTTESVFIVYGDGGGALPGGIVRRFRGQIARPRFVYHRLPVFEAPMSAQARRHAELYAEQIMSTYSENATLVITPLHHVAAPCIAMGVPVVIGRRRISDRFGFLQTLAPIYTPETFHEIDWRPAPINIDGVKRAIEDDVIRRLSRLESVEYTETSE